MRTVSFSQVAGRWVEMHRARSPVGVFLWTVLGLGVGLIALVLLLVVAVVAVPVGLAAWVVLWVRGRLMSARGDGRRNVRVVGVDRSTPGA